METHSDHVLRAMTNDGAFRVIACHTTTLVREAIEAQSVTGETARRFADLLTGAVLVRETMAPQLRVQGIVRGADGSGNLVADSHPDGWSRGLVHVSEDHGEVQFGPGAILEMMRSMPKGDLHRGVVEVPQKGGIQSALMTYMRDSEQVASVIAVGNSVEEGHVATAGGYIVQLLPEVERSSLAIMTERLEQFPDVAKLLTETQGSADRLIEEILFGMPYTRLDDSPLRFDCNCSEVRVITSLATLARSEIEEIVQAGESLHMTCDYCGTPYVVAPDKLKGLLQQS